MKKCFHKAALRPRGPSLTGGSGEGLPSIPLAWWRQPSSALPASFLAFHCAPLALLAPSAPELLITSWFINVGGKPKSWHAKINCTWLSFLFLKQSFTMSLRLTPNSRSSYLILPEYNSFGGKKNLYTSFFLSQKSSISVVSIGFISVYKRKRGNF